MGAVWGLDPEVQPSIRHVAPQVFARLLQLRQQRLLRLRRAGDDLSDQVDLVDGWHGLALRGFGRSAVGGAERFQDRVDPDVTPVVVGGGERPVIGSYRAWSAEGPVRVTNDR